MRGGMNDNLSVPDQPDDDAPFDLDAAVEVARKVVTLGGFDPVACGRGLRMTDEQIAFGLEMLKKPVQTDALRMIGWGSNPTIDAIRGKVAAGGKEALTPDDLLTYTRAERALRKKAAEWGNSDWCKAFLEKAAENKGRRQPVKIRSDQELLEFFSEAMELAPKINDKLSCARAINEIRKRIADENPHASQPVDFESMLAWIARHGPQMATLANGLSAAYGFKFRSPDGWTPAEVARFAVGLEPLRPNVTAPPLDYGADPQAVDGPSMLTH